MTHSLNRFARFAFLMLVALQTGAVLEAALLDWSNVSYTTGDLGETYVVDDGDIVITVTGTTAGFTASSPEINTDLTAPPFTGESFYLNTNYNTAGAGPPYSITLTIDFTVPQGVTDVSFSIFDLDQGPDQWIDRVTITGTDAQTTTLNPSSIGAGADNQQVGSNQVLGTAGSSEGDADGSASFTFNQDNIKQIVIVYENLGTDRGNQWIGLSDVSWNEMGFLANSTKSATPAVSSAPNVSSNELITYQIDVINDGDTDVTNVRVTDDIPANTNSFTLTSALPSGATNNSTGAGTGANNTGFLDIDGFDVSAGSSETITFTVVTDSSLPAGTTFPNTATLTADNGISEDIDSNVLSIPSSDLSTSTKTVNTTNAEAGDTLTYTITITNSDPSIPAVDVQVTDNIPANISSWSIDSIPSGSTDDSTIGGGAFGNGFLDINGFDVAPNSSETIVFFATIDAGTIGGTDIDNSATIEDITGELIVVDAPTVAVTAPVLFEPDVDVKAEDNDGEGEPGQIIDYEYEIKNKADGGTDVFNITATSSNGWKVEMYDVTGTTLIATDNNGDGVWDVINDPSQDTDGNGEPDTGDSPKLRGDPFEDTINYIFRVTIPNGATDGTKDDLEVTATSVNLDEDGNPAVDSDTNETEVKFFDPKAKVDAREGNKDGLPGATVDYLYRIENDADNGLDVLNIIATSSNGWKIELFDETGTTLYATDNDGDGVWDVLNDPSQDSDGNGEPDTGDSPKLAGQEFTDYVFRVTIPPSAAYGTKDDLVVTATTVKEDEDGDTDSDDDDNETTVTPPGVNVEKFFDSNQGTAGQVVVHQFLVVENTVDSPDTFNLTIESDNGWELELRTSDGQLIGRDTNGDGIWETVSQDTNGDGIPDTGVIAGGGFETYSLYVTIPPGANDGDSDDQTLTASSVFDSDFEDSETVETIVVDGVGDCNCGVDNGQLANNVGVSILTDGTLDSDWDTVFADRDNNSCDPQMDRDNPNGSRDLTQFSYTWDNTNVYFYTERESDDNGNRGFVYYVDTNRNGVMESGEPVVAARWDGDARDVRLAVGDYNPDASGGDSMVDGNGISDGYSLPGSIDNLPGKNSPDYQGDWGLSNERAMAWSIPWSALGVPAGTALNFHVSSIDKDWPDGNYDVEDNLAGCGGGPLVIPAAGLTFVADESANTGLPATVVLAHILTNTGSLGDSFTFGISDSGDYSPDSVVIFQDLGTVGQYDAGVDVDITTAGTGNLDPSESMDILILYTLGASDLGVSSVTTTATSALDSNIFESVVDTITSSAPPSFTVVKSVRVDDGNLISGDDFYIPGAEIIYTVVVTNSGLGSPDPTTFLFTDDLPDEVDLFLGDFAGPSNGPIDFDQGSEASGLTYSFVSLGDGGDSITFLDSGGSSITPNNSIPGSANYDPAVRAFEIRSTTNFAPWSGSGAQPSFEIEYRVRLR